MVNVMIEWLHAAGYRKREIQGLVEEHLKSVILKNFDSTKADLIFTEEGSVSVVFGGRTVRYWAAGMTSLLLSYKLSAHTYFGDVDQSE